MAVDMMRIFMPQKEIELKLEQRKAKRILDSMEPNRYQELSHKRRLAERKRQVQEKLNQRKRRDDEGKAVMLNVRLRCCQTLQGSQSGTADVQSRRMH